MTNYILIDSKTRAPVPLPFYTQTVHGRPVTITGVTNQRINYNDGRFHGTYVPSMCNLELITEADFMAERA